MGSRIIHELKQTARGRELAVVSVYLYLMRGIQCGKVIIISIDLGSFVYAEAHGCEDIDQLVTHLS